MLDVILCIRNRIYRDGLQRLLADRVEFGAVRACCALRGLSPLLHLPEREAILFDATVEADRPCGDPIRAAYCEAEGRPVIVLGTEGSEAELVAAIEAGAAACVTCDDSIDDLVAAILAAAAGELVCPPRIGRLLQARLVSLQHSRAGAERLSRLSQREHHVLTLLEGRLSNKEIARRLGLEVSTIKNHVHSIIVKLGVSGRAEAAELKRSFAG
jgi:DNA-binding NarL/FixJ family response regulator